MAARKPVSDALSRTIPIFLSGERVVLRPVSMDDLPNVLRWRNDPDARQFMFFQVPHTESDARKRVEAAADARDRLELAIIHRRSGLHIGQLGLFNLDWRSRHAWFGIIVGEAAYRGQGLGGEATELLLGYSFDTLNLHRIVLDVYEFNDAGIRCYERLGFVRECICREAHAADGRYWNVYRYAMLEQEFRNRRGARSGQG